MSMILENVAAPVAAAKHLEDMIGNTPLVAFERITAHLPSNVEIYAKAEWTNPGGSVKDRPALNIIREAERAGHLPGKTILDSTSGNTGIAYAMLGAAKGYKVKLFVPANVSSGTARHFERLRRRTGTDRSAGRFGRRDSRRA